MGRCTQDFASSFLLSAFCAGRIAPLTEGDISILLDGMLAHWSRERGLDTYQMSRVVLSYAKKALKRWLCQQGC